MASEKLILKLDDPTFTIQQISAQPESTRANLFLLVGHRLLDRFKVAHSPDDLDNAVKMLQNAAAFGGSAADNNLYLVSLASALDARFERNGSIDDLNGVVTQYERLLSVVCPHSLSRLGSSLHSRFQMTGGIEDLDRAIAHLTEAISLTLEPGDELATRLNNLGAALQSRFERYRESDDINNAVTAYKRASNSVATDDLRVVFVSNLSMALRIRSEASGDANDLDDAMKAAEEALDFAQQGSPDAAICLDTLSTISLRKAQSTGSADYLDLAIRKSEEAIEISERAEYYNNLALALQQRFEISRSTEDLNRAISILDRVIGSTPQRHVSFSIRRVTLGNALWSRFDRTRSIMDINRAIAVYKEAIAATPKDHANLSGYINNLGNSLHSRFEYTKNLIDLDEAIESYNQAVTWTSSDNPDKAMYFGNLGNALRTRYQTTHSDADLDSAIAISDRAVASTPESHPSLSIRINNLGIILQCRYERTKSLEDLDCAMIAYEKAVTNTAGPTYARLVAANTASALVIGYDLRRAKSLLETALHLLPLLGSRLLKQGDRQHWVSQFNGMTVNAVSASLGCDEDPFSALQLSELGRGVIARVWLDIRFDVSNLREKYPELAVEFEEAQGLLDIPEAKIEEEHYRISSQRFDSLLSSVRALPGFERFLLGPSELELISLAEFGPIVVFNVSDIRSDALLVTGYSIRSIQLPLLSKVEVQAHSNRFLSAISETDDISYRKQTFVIKKVLEWLWDAAVRPVLAELGLTRTPAQGEAWPRIWWVGCGLLTTLPFHAAGYHDVISPRFQTALDCVISSYTPTITALAYARERGRRGLNSNAQKLALLAMEKTSERPDLPFARNEVDELQRIMPSSIQSTILEHPTKAKAEELFRDHHIIHMACHAESSGTDPSQSMLLLSDWKTNPLTVLDLASTKLANPQLAYLSACHTGVSRDLSLQDESIHLISATQLAGYPSVVGSLWQVEDRRSADIAKLVYKFMLENELILNTCKAAEGLHFAIRAVREETKIVGGLGRTDPMIWAPYVHYGM